MKINITYLSIVVFNLFSVEQTTAQVQLTPDTITLESKILKNFAPDFKNLFKQKFDNNIVMNFSGTTPKAKLLSSNEKFDIYTLPLDNMPCLVPNKMFKGNMETMEQTLNKYNEQVLGGKIPNLFKRKVSIPKNKRITE